MSSRHVEFNFGVADRLLGLFRKRLFFRSNQFDCMDIFGNRLNVNFITNQFTLKNIC